MHPRVLAIAEQLRDALQARDLDRTMALFADDAVFTAPEGTYRGLARIRDYHAAVFGMTAQLRLEDTGVGMVPFDGGWVHQHVQTAQFRPDTTVRIPTVAIHRINAEGKLVRVDVSYDNWGVLQQFVTGLPGVRGMVVRLLMAALSRGLGRGMPASD